jgi:hypothetical protein
LWGSSGAGIILIIIKFRPSIIASKIPPTAADFAEAIKPPDHPTSGIKEGMQKKKQQNIYLYE